jgi:hypothetical protein
MGARDYNPYTGTFLQADPIQGGGLNTYGYANGDAVNQTDLTGKGGHGGGFACEVHHDCNWKAIESDPIPSPVRTAVKSVANATVAIAAAGGHFALGSILGTDAALTGAVGIVATPACFGGVSEAPVVGQVAGYPGCAAFAAGAAVITYEEGKDTIDNLRDAGNDVGDAVRDIFGR